MRTALSLVFLLFAVHEASAVSAIYCGALNHCVGVFAKSSPQEAEQEGFKLCQTLFHGETCNEIGLPFTNECRAVYAHTAKDFSASWYAPGISFQSAQETTKALCAGCTHILTVCEWLGGDVGITRQEIVPSNATRH